MDEEVADDDVDEALCSNEKEGLLLEKAAVLVVVAVAVQYESAC